MNVGVGVFVGIGVGVSVGIGVGVSVGRGVGVGVGGGIGVDVGCGMGVGLGADAITSIVPAMPAWTVAWMSGSGVLVAVGSAFSMAAWIVASMLGVGVSVGAGGCEQATSKSAATSRRVVRMILGRFLLVGGGVSRLDSS